MSARRWRWWDAAELLVPVAGVFVLLLFFRHTWFSGDDWAFLGPRRDALRDGDLLNAIFAPHNQHLVAMPAAIYALLVPLVGLESAVPYIGVLLVLHAVAVLGARAIARTIEVGHVWRLVLVTYLTFLGAGAENLAWPFQLALVGGVASGIWAVVHALGVEPPTTRAALRVAALLGSALCFSGIALPFIGAVLVLGVIRRRPAVVAAAVAPLIPYGAWYLGFGSQRMYPIEPMVGAVPGYVLTGISHALSALSYLPGSGVVVVLVAAAFLRTREHSARTDDLLIVAVVVVVGFFGLSSVGRAVLGAEAARASRYVYVVAFVVAPVLCAAGDAAWSRRAAARPVLIAVLVLAVLGAADGLLAERGRRAAVAAESRVLFALAQAVADDPGRPAAGLPDPVTSPDLTYARLAALADEGAWNATPPGLSDRSVRAMGRIAVVTGDDEPIADTGRLEVSVSRLSAVVEADGCLVHEASTPIVVRIVTGQRGVITVTSVENVEFSGVGSDFRSEPQMVHPSVRYDRLAVSTLVGDTLLQLPAHARLCGVSLIR